MAGYETSTYGRLSDVRRGWAPKYDYKPSGQLRIRLGGLEGTGARQSWADGRRAKLDDKLGQVVVGIEAAAEALTQRRIELEARRARWEEERQRAEEQRQRCEQEQRRLNQLEVMSRRWAEAASIRSFVDEVKRAARARKVPDEDLEAWVAWALEAADRVDPVAKVLSELGPAMSAG